MKYLAKYFVLAICVLCIFSGLPVFAGLNEELIAAEVKDGNKIASSEVVDIINDAAMLKIIMLTLPNVYWADKEELRKKLTVTADKIASKYQIDLPNLKFRIEKDAVLDFALPKIAMTGPNGNFSQIVALKDAGKLSSVELKGVVMLSSDSMLINFDDKTECKINEREYVYYNAKWFEK